MRYDIAIVGGGPGGLAAALALGRARKKVLLCDAGPRRNAAAERVHNFVTRDGTPPDEFRRIGREQLRAYPHVEVRDAGVAGITGERGAFRVALADGGERVAGEVEARRVLLCTGMVDEVLPIEGFAALWGRSIFQCPYCHGWEARDGKWAFLVLPGSLPHFLPFALQLRGWTREVTVLAGGLALPGEARAQLAAAAIRIEDAPIARLVARDGQLAAIELAGGTSVAAGALFAHPPQRQVAIVRELGVALDADGYVVTDPMKRETSIPGIYAAGDLSSRMQGAIMAAAAGAHAAAMINVELTMELAASGAL